MNTITVNGIELTLDQEANIEYRSNRTNPNNWVLCMASDKDGNRYECWYEVQDWDEIGELDEIDYNNPTDVINEDGECIR